MQVDLNASVETYAGLEGRDLIKSIARDFTGRVALVSSFGAESSVLLHMVSEVDRNLPIFFLDTGKLFQATLDYRDKLISELGFTNVRSVRPDPLVLGMQDANGELHTISMDACCNIRKTQPLARALKDFAVMISGRKRFHGKARADLAFVSVDDARLKIEPLAGFSALDLQSYMVNHHLPSHPLKLQGYRSIGCEPCTARGGTDENPRAGRWVGTDKSECGIHFLANGQIIRTVQRQAVNA
jgi:phosphoadenosine phosphosulfate reductase